MEVEAPVEEDVVGVIAVPLTALLGAARDRS
jgi:hypothetical protein